MVIISHLERAWVDNENNKDIISYSKYAFEINQIYYFGAQLFFMNSLWLNSRIRFNRYTNYPFLRFAVITLAYLIF
ncbi:hypothetical protein AAKU52_001607 [Pedobacter sp. CG_S7]